MSTAVIKRKRGARRPLGVLRVVDGPYAASRVRTVLVASDGSRPASAAIKLARAMATKGEWAPSVVTVLEPLPVAVGEVVLPAPASQYEIMVTQSALAAISQQVKRYGDAGWRLITEFGSPARQILRAAQAEGAELIVVGLGRHGRLAQMLGAETAARVARHAQVPVLAVSTRTWPARHCAVVAVDFGDASVRAAREAITLLEAPARLHLVHVRSTYNTTSFAESEWERAYMAGAEVEFTRLREQLGEHPGIEIQSTLLVGDVVARVVEEARRLKAQLIALGSHSESVLERVMMGSTPTDILRESPCSVLIAPPADVTP